MKDRTEFRFYCDVCGEFHQGSHEWWSPNYLAPNTPICLLWDLVHNVLNQGEQNGHNLDACEAECSSREHIDNSARGQNFTNLSSLTSVFYSVN